MTKKQVKQDKKAKAKGEPLSENEALEAEVKAFSFFKLYTFASAWDKFLMFIGFLGAFASGGAMPLFSLFFGDIPNTFGPQNGPDSLMKAASDFGLKFVYVGVGAWITSYIGFACWTMVGERQGIEIRRRYFMSLLHQEIAFYDSINPNELSTKITEECFNIQEGIGEKVYTFINAMSMLISGLIIGFIKGWQLTLVLLGFFPVMGVTGAMLGLSMQKLTKVNNEAYAEAGAISEEALNAIRTVVSLGGQVKETKRYEAVMEKNRGPIVKYSIMSGVSLGLIFFVMFAVYALGFFVGSKFIEHGVHNPTDKGPYTVGSVLTVFFAILMASFTPSRAAPCAKAFAIAKASGVKAFKTIDRKSEISINDSRGLKPKSCEGVIQFKDVKFAYPLKKDRIILNGINFTIKKNEKTAFVGESGCGKTTCMQLIERFYDILEGNGSITLDGNELKELNLKWMRENIGYVGQEPVLFAASIKENLLMAKDDATDEEIWTSLKQANAASFVQNLPDKLNTFVGANGAMLSGGQKQRLAIARAILKNPKILLLDEATSALDRKNEKEIQKTLDEISEGRTTIVIAHRLSTIINADHIIVFDQGVVVEEGKHQDLVAKKGRYYALQHLQLQNEEKEKAQFDSNEPNINTDVMSPTEGDKFLVTQGENKGDVILNVKSEESVKTDEKTKKKEKKKKNVRTEGDLKLFYRLLTFSKDDMSLVIIGSTGACILGCAQPFIAPILSNMLFVLALPDAPDFRSRSGLFSGLFLVLAVVAGVSFAVQLGCLGVVAERLSRKIRLSIFKKYVRMPIGWFDDPLHSAGALNSKLSTEANLVNNLTGNVIGSYLQAAASIISGLIIAFVANWKLALIGIGLTPFMVISGKIRAKFYHQVRESSDEAYQESVAFVSEAVNNMRTVASFGKEDKLLENFSRKLDKPLKNSIRNSHLSGFTLGMGEFINFGVYALAFYISAIFMKEDGLNFLDMFMAIMAIMMGAMGAGNAMQFAPDVGSALNAAVSIFKVLDAKPAIDIDDPNQIVRTPIKGDIEFKNVWFKYPSREKQIFKNLSFKISSSNKTAFVGPSGCGKSTILALIQRFYDVDQGEVLIDGVNIKKYDLKHLRESYGVVSQEPVLFNGTIEYNIKYSKEGATDAEMRATAEKACALGFIENNEFDVMGDEEEANKKYGTGFQRKVGPKGSQMSGGQKQRIAIARAILKNPNFLILDEATSALDAQNEKTVQEALDKIMEGKTSVIVAHRITTIKDADEIIVFNEGEIMEKGNYQQLTEKRGMFYKLERGIELTDGV